MTRSARVLPDFLIIGAQKAGTTSLYRNLIKHPCVVPALIKEVYFFALDHAKGANWYRSFFPSKLGARVHRKMHGAFLTCEATPYYIYHPLVPRRARNLVPDAKILAILRNPVDRAYSHYQHVRDLGLETVDTFEEALALETQRLKGEYEKIVQDGDYESYNHRHFSYTSRGIYVDQLTRWFDSYPREQILVLSLEEFKSDWKASFTRVLNFLQLPSWDVREFKKYYSRRYDGMNPETRQRLVEFFRPHNQRLYELLGRSFEWDR